MAENSPPGEKNSPHRLGLGVIGIQGSLQFHVIELLLKPIDPASLDGLCELSVAGLVDAEALELVGQLPVHPSELVEDLLRTHPGVVRLRCLHRHL